MSDPSLKVRVFGFRSEPKVDENIRLIVPFVFIVAAALKDRTQIPELKVNPKLQLHTVLETVIEALAIQLEQTVSLLHAVQVPGQLLQTLLLAYSPIGQVLQILLFEDVIKPYPAKQLVQFELDVQALQLLGH